MAVSERYREGLKNELRDCNIDPDLGLGKEIMKQFEFSFQLHDRIKALEDEARKNKTGNCCEQSPENVIPEETLEWMEQVGIKPFDKPQTYYCGCNHTYSTEYLSSKPLEELKLNHDTTLIRNGEPVNDEASIKA